MKAVLAAIGGLGVGAALMYLFDPDRGNQRRALIRDKAVKYNRETREAIEAKAKDLSNRAKGVVYELKSAVSPENESTTGEPVAGWSNGPAV